MGTDVLETLRERGFVSQISDEAGLRRTLAQGQVGIYAGYDPTAPSLHIGHLLSVMMLAHLQRGGQRPIVVVGGGTGMIGDPTGRTEMRQFLTPEAIQANMEGLKRQFGRYLDFSEGRALMVNNADWLMELGYLQFLRDIGRYFSVNQLLQHSTYRDRLAGEGLNFIELNYALLQAYDFLHLYRTEGCRLQVGGDDQWFNILSGTELIRRVDGGEGYALVSPLITTASGAKMGKSAAGSVWLDPSLTSPYDYYQYWINTADADVERFLALFTFLPMEQVRELGKLQGADIREAKGVLAFEATRLTHGEAEAERARKASEALFRGGAEAEGAPTFEVDRARLASGIELVDLLAESGLRSSKRQARDLIQGRGAYVNDEQVAEVGRVVTEADLRDDAILLRSGKKDYRRVVVR
jgi:tyrosyl-tRNA synthetase